MPEKDPPYKPVASYKPLYKPMESISFMDYIKEKNSGIKPFGIVQKEPNRDNIIAAQGLKFPSGYSMLGYGVVPTRKNPYFKGVLGAKGTFPIGENTSISLGGEGAIGQGKINPRIGFTHRFDNGGRKYPSGPYYPYKGNTLRVDRNYDKTHVQPLPFKYGGCRRYDFGSTMRSIGAGAYGVGEGLLDTLTFGATDALTDKGYDKLSAMGKDRTQEEIERDRMIRGFSNTAGAIGGAVLTGGATTGAAISEGSEGLAEGVTNIAGTGEEFDKWANLAGQVGSMAGGFVGGGGELGGALEGSQGAQNLMNYSHLSPQN